MFVILLVLFSYWTDSSGSVPGAVNLRSILRPFFLTGRSSATFATAPTIGISFASSFFWPVAADWGFIGCAQYLVPKKVELAQDIASDLFVKAIRVDGAC